MIPKLRPSITVSAGSRAHDVCFRLFSPVSPILPSSDVAVDAEVFVLVKRAERPLMAELRATESLGVGANPDIFDSTLCGSAFRNLLLSSAYTCEKLLLSLLLARPSRRLRYPNGNHPSNIPYDAIKETVLDIPPAECAFEGQRPCVIVFHGGCWTGGTKESPPSIRICLRYVEPSLWYQRCSTCLRKSALAPAAVTYALKPRSGFAHTPRRTTWIQAHPMVPERGLRRRPSCAYGR